MKRLVIVLLVFTIGIGSYENPDTTRVKVGKNEVVNIVDDTIKVKIGKKGIKIIENEDGTSIDIIDLDETEDEKDFSYKRKFKGHWKGFEMGLNNLSTEKFSLSLPASNNFMNLNTGKSWNVNINFLQYGLGLIGNNIGIVTGLGLELNDYRFDNNNSITKDVVNGMIVENTYVLSLEKSKFTTSYLTVPLLLEFQVPAGRRNKRLFISGGVIGGLKIGSHTKIVYKEDGNRKKDKNRGDFNLSPLRYAVTARIGYRALKVFANFYLTPLFQEDTGRELYPFSVGLVFINF